MAYSARITGGAFMLLAAAAAAQAERIELRDGDVLLWAPAAVDCASPPEFTLEGGTVQLFSPDRSVVDGLVSQMATGLAASCEDLKAVTIRGEDRGVSFSFTVTREDRWRLDAGPAPEPEAAPTPAAVQTPSPAVAEEPPVETVAAPEPPARREVAPGLDFQTFTSIFGSVPTVRGHVAFDNSEIWSRVLAARMYAENPAILQNDVHAIELLGQMATQPEYVQVLGPLAGTQPAQMSVFERRDIAERIRTQLAGGLDQRRQTGPILVYNTVQLRLGEYDFSTQSFPLPNITGVRNHRQVAWKNAAIQHAFANIVLPQSLRATQEQARQLDAYLRGRNDPNLYLAIFAEIDPEMPRTLSDHRGNQPGATHTKLTQIALFADKGLSQILYDFTPDLAAKQAEADVAAAALTQAISSGEDAVAAIDAVNGGPVAATALADVAARTDWTGAGETPEARRAAALASLASGSPSKTMRLSGWMRFGTYDSFRKVLPVDSIGLQGLPFTAVQANAGFNVNLIPTLSEIPMDPATAARISGAAQRGQLEFRLDAELMQGSHQSHGGDYIQFNAILKPDTLQLFTGRQNYYGEPREMLLNLKLPETTSVVPSLMDALAPPQ